MTHPIHNWLTTLTRTALGSLSDNDIQSLQDLFDNATTPSVRITYPLGQTQQEILSVMEVATIYKSRDIQVKIKRHQATTATALKSLVARGLVTRVGHGRYRKEEIA